MSNPEGWTFFSAEAISSGVYWSGKPTVYFCPSVSVTLAVLSFSFSVRLLTWPASNCASRLPNVCFCEWLELPISFWAKNASTTTIRIGKAALLKNLLIGDSAHPARRLGIGSCQA